MYFYQQGSRAFHENCDHAVCRIRELPGREDAGGGEHYGYRSENAPTKDMQPTPTDREAMKIAEGSSIATRPSSSI